MDALADKTITKGDEGAALLERLSRGDEGAIAAMYSLYADQLLSYGKGLGFGREQLKDAIHDVFWKLCSSRGAVADVRHLKAYLFRALKNRLLNGVKADARSASLDGHGDGFSITVTVMDELIEEEDRHAVEGRIEGYLATLTDRQREAVYLRFIEELEYDEIAALLDITSHATRKLVSRAITSIRDNNLAILLIMAGSVGVLFNK